MKGKRSIIVMLAIGVLTIFCIVFYPKLQGRSELLRLGAILPLTGDAATYGQAIKQGISLAVDELNSAGGVNGVHMLVIYEDDQAEPKKGVDAAHKLIDIDRVPAIIGAVPSSVTLAVAPIAEQSRTVLLSPASSSPKITDAGDFIFRNYPSDVLEGKLVASFAVKHSFTPCALLTIKNEYGEGLNRVFASELVNEGCVIVANEKYPENTADFRTILTKLRENDPKSIFIVGYGKQLGTIVKQARELGISAQFLSTVNFLDQQSLVTGGDAVEGVIFSSPMFDAQSNLPYVKAFVKSFQKAFGKSPDVWSAHGYDAMNILAEAIRRQDARSESIRQSLYAISNFPGVAGTTTFDTHGDVVKDVRFMTVKQGQFVSY